MLVCVSWRNNLRVSGTNDTDYSRHHALLVIVHNKLLIGDYGSNSTAQVIPMTMTASTKQGSKRSKWALDFAHKTKQDRSVEIPSPPGYTPTGVFHNVEYMRETDSNHLIIKKSWDLALGPLKQVPMNLFIMYMAGSSISIFPIMMVGMLIIRPVKALFTLQQTFKVIEGTHAFGQKFVYFLGQLVNIALALYKCQSMGLLPTHASDWLAFVEPQTRVEYSGGGFMYI